MVRAMAFVQFSHSSDHYLFQINVINEDVKGLEQVTAYLDDVLVFDSDSTAHVKTIRTFF